MILEWEAPNKGFLFFAKFTTLIMRKGSQDKIGNGRIQACMNPCNKVDKPDRCRMQACMNH